MSPKYTINKSEGEHFSPINRIHLAQEWNVRVRNLDAKLSFRSFAKIMHIRESSWRREYARGGVFVLYDRLSRRYWLEKLLRIDQDCVVKAIRRIRVSKRIGRIRSVVTDNGCEFLDQNVLDKAFHAKVYYTRAYASYEKGGVENCNRILRRWFPKGTDFSKVSTQRIHQVEGFINTMHRASLGGQTAERRDEELCRVA